MWTTVHCDNQDTPQLTVQNLTFIDANSKSETEYDGGGAIWVRGGRFKIVNSRFFNNVCADTGPDVGGAASACSASSTASRCTWSTPPSAAPTASAAPARTAAASAASACRGPSSTACSRTTTPIGNGGNPAEPGTPGGGSGGAIYNDGNTMTLSLCGTRSSTTRSTPIGSAIFFVSNDHTGNIVIDRSVITNNIGGSWYPTYPQISNHDDTPITVTDSVIQ